MTDLLNLATSLRAKTDQQLLATLRRRTAIGAPKDFFDLAQNLLAPKSISSALNRLSGSEVFALSQLLDGRTPSKEARESLVELALCVPDTTGAGDATGAEANVAVLEGVAQLAAPLLSGLALAEPSDAPATGSARTVELTPEPGELGLAAIAAFETQQALCELLLDAETHALRHTGKTGFGITDVKRLAEHLAKTNQTVRALYALAEALQLLHEVGNRWWLTVAAKQFLNHSLIERWLVLARHWIAALGAVGAAELLEVQRRQPELSLSSALKTVFPLADSNLGDQLGHLVEQAQGIGFAVYGRPSVLLQLALQERFDAAADLLQNHLPQLQHSLIVQADLTLIAPGPLDTATEMELRKFAQLEQVSVASSYRLSAQSIASGLERGLSIDSIRATLRDLNQKELPQPVDYVLKDTAAKFGRLQIWPGPGGAEKSVVKSTDGLLLTSVLNDSRLRAFAFVATTAGSISTRFEAEVLYSAMRDHGYIVCRVDNAGALLAAKSSELFTGGLADATTSPLQLLVDNLRAADARVGSEPDDQDIARQIQLAVKSKAVMTVVARDAANNEIEFHISPTALANGRLRGMDKRNDVERTIPLNRILRVRLG
jgi:hypothetical protein